MEKSMLVLLLGTIFIGFGLSTLYAGDYHWEMRKLELMLRGIKPERTEAWDSKRILWSTIMLVLGTRFVIGAIMLDTVKISSLLAVISLFSIPIGGIHIAKPDLAWKLHQRWHSVWGNKIRRTRKWDDLRKTIGSVLLTVGVGLAVVTLCTVAWRYVYGGF